MENFFANGSQTSLQIVPNRLYPWYLLTKLYDETGEKDKVCETAAIVQTKEAKVQSTVVNEMREETKKICERWNISSDHD